jgi:hypothetical protein
MTSLEMFDRYNNLHTEFGEAYQLVNQHVLDAYGRPRNFIRETAPVIDRFIRENSVPGAPRQRDLSAQSVFEFIHQTDDFTFKTIELFDEHKAHVEDCVNYLKKVAALKKKHSLSTVDEKADDYIRLTPELHQLQNGLSVIKLKADQMLARLEKLELRWMRIKAVVAC